MNHSTQLRLAADVIDRILPANQSQVTVITHAGFTPTIQISEQAFRQIFAGKEATREPMSGGDMYLLAAEMFDIRFQAVEYGEQKPRETVLI